MLTDIISLIKQTETVDAYGDTAVTETSRDVFCEFLSISQSEFYQAQAAGLKPEMKFKLQDYLDYEDEKIVKYNTERYTVLRTYRDGQALEITVYRENNPK